jgi:hypothetical protein
MQPHISFRIVGHLGYEYQDPARIKDIVTKHNNTTKAQSEN